MSSTVERNNELFPAVVAGDAEARRALIEENMALVVVKVDSLTKQMPSIAHLRDDLIGAGYLGLVKAVNKVASGKVKTAKALNNYIGRSITRDIFQLLPHERTIHIPRESNRLARQSENPIPIPIVIHTLPKTLATPSLSAVVDLHNLFDSCCISEAELECLRLREDGHTFPEIAAILAVPQTTLYDMFRRLRARIAVKLEESE